ncbi:MAG: WD40 repeat domain-containing protein [Cyanobacteria bacterium P01_D01_bin.44]
MTSKSRSRTNASAKAPSSKTYEVHWQGLLNDYITALAWSPDGTYLAASSAKGEVLLWSDERQISVLSGESEPEKPKPEKSEPGEFEPGEFEPRESGRAINCLGFSSDGDYLAAAGQQGEVFIWQVQSLDQPNSQPVNVLQNSHCWVDRLAWHPTQPWLAFGAGSQVQVWDVTRAERLTAQDFAASSVLGLAWHPQGTLLAVSGHGGVKVWRSDDWDAEPEFTEVPGASVAVAWSLDGQYLASGNLDRTLTVVAWDKPPPWLMQGFPGKVRQVVWSPTVKGQAAAIAAACLDGITIWRRQGNNWQSQVLQQHRQTVVAIAFHPTHPLLASAAQDGQVCLWQNAKSLQQTLKGVSQGFSSLAWHPQGSYLAAGGDQGELIIWAPSNRGQGFQKR